MEGLAMLGAVGAMIGAVVGATWALRTKLSDIEVALGAHVIESKAGHKNHEGRIIKLEGRRNARR